MTTESFRVLWGKELDNGDDTAVALLSIFERLDRLELQRSEPIVVELPIRKRKSFWMKETTMCVVSLIVAIVYAVECVISERSIQAV